MLTNIQEQKYTKWTNFSLFFLALGFLSSPTVVSLFHIFLAIPALIVFYKYKEIKLPKSSWMLILLTAWGMTSTLVNLETIVKPFKSFQEVKFYLLGTLFIPIFYIYFKNATKHQLKKLVSIVSFIIIAAFFVGISKAYLGFDPIKMKSGEYHIRSGGFTNYMRYGYASAFLFIFGLGLFFNRKKEFVSYLISSKLFYPAFALSLLAIGTSQTRGAMLAVLVGVPFMLLKYKPRIAKILISLGATFAAIIVYCSFINPNVTKLRFLNVNQESNNVRMSQFVSAIKSIEEKPIFGLGADQFSYNVIRIKEKYNIWAKDYSGHAHNIFLEHAADYGLVGLALFIAFLVLWFSEMIKRKDDLGWVIASYIVAFTISGQVENLFDNTNSHLLFFIYTFSQVYKNQNMEKNI